MIIKLIPETKEEKERYESKGVEEIEHTNVKEFIIFGNKIDQDSDLVDFHEWHGSYRYLMGSLSYFYEIMNDTRKNQNNSNDIQVQVANKNPEPMVKRGEITSKLQPLDVSPLQEEEQLDKQTQQKESSEKWNPQGLKIVKK